jgi:hypothetical protein
LYLQFLENPDTYFWKCFNKNWKLFTEITLHRRYVNLFYFPIHRLYENWLDIFPFRFDCLFLCFLFVPTLFFHFVFCLQTTLSSFCLLFHVALIAASFPFTLSVPREMQFIIKLTLKAIFELFPFRSPI